MSGLFGVVDFAAPYRAGGISRARECASYRAPGGIGYRFLGEAGSLICASPATGRPAAPRSRSPRSASVLDGRLDNRSELIAQLAPAEGTSGSDVRLLLAAYLRWGEACTDHLLGDFAFAVWDAGRRRLLCAVDPLGIKPLHFARVGPLVCFASDAVQVLAHPAVPDGYDEAEIAAYLAGQCEDPERSFFAAIHKLAPGQRLIADAGGLRVERYWYPATRGDPLRPGRGLRRPFPGSLPAGGDRSSPRRGELRGGRDERRSRLDLGGSGRIACPQAPKSGLTPLFSTSLPECDERSYSRAMTEELGGGGSPIEAEFDSGTWNPGFSLHSAPIRLSSARRTCYQRDLPTDGCAGFPGAVDGAWWGRSTPGKRLGPSSERPTDGVNLTLSVRNCPPRQQSRPGNQSFGPSITASLTVVPTCRPLPTRLLGLSIRKTAVSSSFLG